MGFQWEVIVGTSIVVTPRLWAMGAVGPPAESLSEKNEGGAKA